MPAHRQGTIQNGLSPAGRSSGGMETVVDVLVEESRIVTSSDPKFVTQTSVPVNARPKGAAPAVGLTKNGRPATTRRGRHTSGTPWHLVATRAITCERARAKLAVRPMPHYTTRLAREDDLPAIAAMVDDFVASHPAADHPRPLEGLREAFFGDAPVAEVIVAEADGEVVGMGQWFRIYDMFWAKFGGQAEWLYLRPEVRGRGLWVSIVAAICDRIRQSGGTFLAGPGNEQTSRLYERVTEGAGPTWMFHLSEEAFQRIADLRDVTPREAVRRLPEPHLNRVPAAPR